MRILIASSSSGGHINPSISFGNYLESKGHQVTYLGFKNQVEEKLIDIDKLILINGSNSFNKNKLYIYNNRFCFDSIDYHGILKELEKKMEEFHEKLEKNGLKMENDDFSRIAKDNFEYLQKMIFILSAGYEQRTEIASLLLKVLDEVNDYNTKVVLFANLISFCERRAAQIQKKTGTTATSEE